MATQNAIDIALPAEVSKGGTDSPSLSNHGVLVGSGTSPITVLTVGATGELLTGISSADSAFDTFVAANFSFNGAIVGGDRELTVENTDNTSTSSFANLQISTGGGLGGDPFVTYSVESATQWSFGLDNSDSDKLKVSASGSIGTTDAFVMTTDGAISRPLQPTFLAYNTTDRNNVTGDGSEYTLIYNSEIYDIGSDWDGTSTFTAPVSGKYHFSVGVPIGGIQAAHEGFIKLKASNRTITICTFAIGAIKTGSDRGQMWGNSYVDMDVADTVTFSITLSGGALVADFRGNASASGLSAFAGGRLVN